MTAPKGPGQKPASHWQSSRPVASMSASETLRPSAERLGWALVGRKRGNTAKSAIRRGRAKTQFLGRCAGAARKAQ